MENIRNQMKFFKHKKIILITIIVLAFVLRFYKLESYPALNADEASIGYDAYSLIETGKDQHGNPWPINFQSFNDYKPGLYVYAVLPFIKILGLNELAVRIPNALIGVASVFLVYALIKELFGKEKENFALLSALFLSISPWHIHFSRGGWETNTATFLIMLAILFFAKFFNSEKKKILYLISSILFFVLSIYCYQATRLTSPLIGFGLILIYHKEIFKNIKPVLIAGIIAGLLLVPLLLDFTKGNVLSRAAGVGLFADPGPRSRVEEQRGQHQQIDSIAAKTLHNKLTNYGLAFVANWAKHFHGEFLFLSGDEVTRSKVPETGVMYLIDILFIISGAIVIFRKKKEKGWQIILMWIVVAPLASALTFQAPSALRAQSLVVPLVVISSYGCLEIIKMSKNSKQFKNIIYVLIGFSIIWCFARYLQMYYVHMSKEYSYSSQYGVKELVDYVSKYENKYKKILITDRYDQPYILFLFYLKYPPQRFQSEHDLTNRDGYGFSTVNHFGKYYFSSIKFDQAKPENPNTMIIGTNEEIPREANIVKNIYGENNDFLYFKIVAN